MGAAIMRWRRFILRAGTLDAVETEVRRARALRPPAADKQLPELATRGIGRPAWSLRLLPARNHAPSADQRTRARRRLPRGVGIFRRQHQRLRQEVDAIANPDGQIPGPSGAALHAGSITALGEAFSRVRRAKPQSSARPLS